MTPEQAVEAVLDAAADWRDLYDDGWGDVTDDTFREGGYTLMDHADYVSAFRLVRALDALDAAQDAQRASEVPLTPPSDAPRFETVIDGQAVRIENVIDHGSYLVEWRDGLRYWTREDFVDALAMGRYLEPFIRAEFEAAEASV